MCAVANRAVFCSSLNSCFYSTLLRYFLNDYEMVSGITFVCTFQIHFVSVLRPYMFLNSLNYFPSPEIATYINIHVPIFIITYYDVHFIVRYGSVSFHLLIP